MGKGTRNIEVLKKANTNESQHEISNLRIFSTSVKMRKCREISLRTN